MADRENEKKYSAETKGYTDKIYEVRFMPVLERSEYQAGLEREGLIKLQGIMEEKDFEKYINNGLIRITQDGDRLMMISKSEMYRSMLMGTNLHWEQWPCHPVSDNSPAMIQTVHSFAEEYSLHSFVWEKYIEYKLLRSKKQK